MAIVNSYVKLPEGISADAPQGTTLRPNVDWIWHGLP